ncbi:hypothetical protein Tco_0500396 [Tanacetum coccineum]
MEKVFSRYHLGRDMDTLRLRYAFGIRSRSGPRNKRKLFRRLKAIYEMQPILSMPDDPKRCSFCDSSNQGLGCVLMQRGKVENAIAEMLRGLDQLMKRKEGGALYEVSGRPHVLWAEIGEIRLIGSELVQVTTNKVMWIKEKLKAARDCQKSYVGNMRKHLELKLEYWTDVNMHVPLEEIKVHKTLRFVKEPVEIINPEVKSLKRSSISIVKVCWDSKRGHEDFMRTNYSHLLIEQDIDGSTN